VLLHLSAVVTPNFPGSPTSLAQHAPVRREVAQRLIDNELFTNRNPKTFAHLANCAQNLLHATGAVSVQRSLFPWRQVRS
jgi:hypothetical protein